MSCYFLMTIMITALALIFFGEFDQYKRNNQLTHLGKQCCNGLHISCSVQITKLVCDW